MHGALAGLSRAALDTALADYGGDPLTSAASRATRPARPLRRSRRGRRRGVRRREVAVRGPPERRKGVDVLLEAVSALIEEGHDVTLDLAGPDTPHTESDRTYREAFEAGAPAAVAERVSFAGPVSDERLHELYAAAGRSLANGLP